MEGGWREGWSNCFLVIQIIVIEKRVNVEKHDCKNRQQDLFRQETESEQDTIDGAISEKESFGSTNH